MVNNNRSIQVAHTRVVKTRQGYRRIRINPHNVHQKRPFLDLLHPHALGKRGSKYLIHMPRADPNSKDEEERKAAEAQRKNLEHWKHLHATRNMPRPKHADPNLPRYYRRDPSERNDWDQDYHVDVVDTWDNDYIKKHKDSYLGSLWEKVSVAKWERMPKDLKDKWFPGRPWGDLPHIALANFSYEEIRKYAIEFEKEHPWHWFQTIIPKDQKDYIKRQFATDDLRRRRLFVHFLGIKAGALDKKGEWIGRPKPRFMDPEGRVYFNPPPLGYERGKEAAKWRAKRAVEAKAKLDAQRPGGIFKNAIRRLFK